MNPSRSFIDFARCPVAEVHHFTYGAFNPIAAYLLAFLGSFFGLLSTARARDARTKGRRNRWLVIAAFAIGGAVWLMHFTAFLGFDVPLSPVRFDVTLTLTSLAYSVLGIGLGLLLVGNGRPRAAKLIPGGLIAACGVLAMHYTGMYGVHVAGHVRYDQNLVAASVVIAVVAATVAMWFSVSVRGWTRITLASAVVGAAVCGMHYTSMAAVAVELDPVPGAHVNGIRPLTMIVPITVLAAATIVGVALSALQAMTEEEFTDGAIPRRGMHAESVNNPWSLKQMSPATAPGRRPSPRPPVPLRSTTGS
jgi:NO-binding membrane sensor protein with MHYT domain